MSNINAADINELYPVAGQDNDSQGFRDNFDLIKTALTTAKTEITALETTTAQGVVFDSATNTNDFNGNIIREANMIANTEEARISDVIESDTTVNWSLGNYQILTVGDAVTLTLTGWPSSGKMGRMRVGIKTNDGITKNIVWAASGGGTIKTNSAFPGTFQVTSSTDTIFVDFWTSDGGTTVYAEYLGLFD